MLKTNLFRTSIKIEFSKKLKKKKLFKHIQGFKDIPAYPRVQGYARKVILLFYKFGLFLSCVYQVTYTSTHASFTDHIYIIRIITPLCVFINETHTILILLNTHP